MKNNLAQLGCGGILLFGLLASGSVQAVEFKGAKIADQVKVADKNLVLNGYGIRTKTFLKVNVYVGALYLESKSHDPQEILNSSGEKRVELAFVHSAKASQVQDAFNEAYEDNCDKDCAALKAPFEKLKGLMTSNIEVGDRLAFDFYPSHVDAWVKGQKVGTIEDANFPKALLKTWLGEHPPTEVLRDGMLDPSKN